MPVEVRELIIKATVQGGHAAEPAAASSAASPAEEMINSCVEKVLEILKEKNGR